VAVISQSDAARWAEQTNITVRPIQTFSQAQRYFDEGEVDVFIHDRAVLEYMINRKNLTDMKFSPLAVSPSEYVIALPQGSALREPINLALLEIIKSSVWDTELESYFGVD